MSRKIFVALIFILAAFVGGNLVTKNICSASMPYNEMSLGGITYESTYSDLIRTYGRPTYQNPGVEHEAECHYGNDVKIFYNSFQNKINTVIVTANNGWATPRGLTVGMNISTALDLYGSPEYSKSGAFKTAYCYFHKTFDRQNNRTIIDSGFLIVFNKSSGKILELSIRGSNSMVGFDEVYQDIIGYMVNE